MDVDGAGDALRRPCGQGARSTEIAPPLALTAAALSPFVAGSPASLAAAGRCPALPHRRPSLAAQLHLSSEENVAFSQTVASVVAGAQRKARRMTMTAQSLGLFSPSKERSE